MEPPKRRGVEENGIVEGRFNSYDSVESDDLTFLVI